MSTLVQSLAYLPVQRRLEILCAGLNMESERERTSFQLLSTDSEEIRSLFRAMGLLHAAIADINEMVGTAASQEVAFVAIRRLEGDIRNQISLEWSGRHFRASESLTRTLDIIVCAESNLGR